MKMEIPKVGTLGFEITPAARFPGGWETLPVENDGFVTMASVIPSILSLTVKVKPTTTVVAVRQTGGKDKKLVGVDPTKVEGGWRTFRQPVWVQEGKGGSYTKSFLQDIRFSLVEPDLSYTYWQTALVCQDDRLYLSVQKKADGQFYRNERGSIEGTDGREELLDLLKPLVKDKLLPKMSQVERNGNGAEPLPIPDDPNTALVEWYDQYRQVGCISTADGRQIKVHWRECPVQTEHGWRGLFKGQLVRFATTRPLHARTKSDFALEAQELTLLAPPSVPGTLVPPPEA